MSVAEVPFGEIDVGSGFKSGGTRVTVAGQPAWHGVVNIVGAAPPGVPTVATPGRAPR